MPASCGRSRAGLHQCRSWIHLDTNIGWGILALRGWRPAPTAALITAGLLALVFTWRSSVTWMAVAGGNSEKVIAACIITAMLIASIALIAYTLRSRAALAKAS